MNDKVKKAGEKKSETVSFRLRPSDRGRFENLMGSLNCTAPVLFELMLNSYEAQQNNTYGVGNSPISLLMCSYSAFPTSQYKPLKKTTFKGSVLFQPEQMYHITLTTGIWKALCEEFFQDPNSDLLCPEELYSFYHVLNLYFHEAENRYLVQERLWMTTTDEYSYRTGSESGFEVLNVSRCSFVADYADLHTRFAKYAHPHNLNALSLILAEEIEENYEIMDDFFPLLKR